MQGIVIQGPTNYYKEIAYLYKGISNVVWSTWNTEPELNIKYIKSSGISVIQNPLPEFAGHLNINYQTYSTFKGIEYLKSKGVTEILKIRGDLQPNNIKLLLKILKWNSLAFLAICKPNVRPLYYELEYQHTSFDFPVDLVIYGNVERLEKCFNFQVEENIPIPPEALITYNYFKNTNREFILTYESLQNNNIDFFMKECLNNNITIQWLKQGWDIIKYHSDKTLYEY